MAHVFFMRHWITIHNVLSQLRINSPEYQLLLTLDPRSRQARRLAKAVMKKFPATGLQALPGDFEGAARAGLGLSELMFQLDEARTPHAIVRSDTVRTEHTYQALVAGNPALGRCPVVVREDIVERVWGDKIGKLKAGDVNADYNLLLAALEDRHFSEELLTPEGLYQFSLEGGESPAMVVERLRGFYTWLSQTYAGQTVVVLGHGSAGGLLKGVIGGYTPAEMMQAAYTDTLPNLHGFVCKWEGARLVLQERPTTSYETYRP